MKKTIKDYMTVLFGTGFARGVAFLNSVIIARFLGPNEFGKFSIFYMVMILTWIFPDAFDITFVRYARESDCKVKKNNFLKTAIFLKLMYGLIVLLLAYPLSYFFANVIFLKPQVQNFLILSFVCGVFLSFLKTLASTYQEKEKFIQFSSLHAFYSCFILLILVLFMIFKFSLSARAAVLIYLGVSVVVGLICMRLLFKKTGELFPLDFDVFRTSFSLSKWIFGITCLFYVFQRLDTLFLARYVNFDLMGIYFVAAQIVMLISLVGGTLVGVFLPKASIALKSKESFRVYIKESIFCSGIINIFIVALIIAIPFCIEVLYGKEYSSAALIVQILLAGWIFDMVYLPFSLLFYSINDSRSKFFLEVVKITTAVILLCWLVPIYSLMGGALAISLALISNAVISMLVLKHRILNKHKDILRLNKASG